MKKLLKYDLKAIARIWWMMAIGVSVLSFVGAIAFRFFLENIENVRCLDMTDEYNLADSRIRDDYNYEISHNHYEVEYYRRQYHKLQNIIISDMLGGREKTRYFNAQISTKNRLDE